MPPLRGNHFNGAPDRRALIDALPRERLKTTPEVITAMGGLGKVLRRAGLKHLEPFNKTYLDVTVDAYRKVQEDKFDCPYIVMDAISDFAQRWFDPVTQFGLKNRRGMTRTWQVAFYDPFMWWAEPAVQFGVGMLSHVWVDLPKTVCALKAPKEYKRDYTDHIHDSLQTVANNSSDYYLPVAGRLQSFLSGGAMYALAGGREKSWNVGEELLEAGGDIIKVADISNNIDQQTANAARLLLYMGDITLKGAELAFPAAA